MSWEDLEGAAPQGDPAAQERAEDDQRVIDNAAVRALAVDNQRPLLRYLQKIAMSRSYRPGRDAADTAWSEGYRALAVELLTRAGVTHE